MAKRNKNPYKKPQKHEIPKVPPEGFKTVHGIRCKQKVYTNGVVFISADIDQHVGGWWKVAEKIDKLWHKNTRLGTFNKDLTKRLGR